MLLDETVVFPLLKYLRLLRPKQVRARIRDGRSGSRVGGSQTAGPAESKGKRRGLLPDSIWSLARPLGPLLDPRGARASGAMHASQKPNRQPEAIMAPESSL